jgi:hypothetical protein
VPPSGLKGNRPDSGNFRNREVGFGLSVTLWAGDGDLEDIRRDNEHCGVVTIVAADARALGLMIARAPLEGNPNHCELFPAISGGRRKLLGNASEWVVYPEIVPLENRVAVVTWHDFWDRRIPADEVARFCG